MTTSWRLTLFSANFRAQVKVDAERQQTFLKKIQDFLIKELPIERESVTNIEACLDEIVKIQDGNDEMMKACGEQEILKVRESRCNSTGSSAKCKL